jgi:hypothetical protein
MAEIGPHEVVEKGGEVSPDEQTYPESSRMLLIITWQSTISRKLGGFSQPSTKY